MMRDAEFGMIRLRAFGTYAMRIADAKQCFATLVGTQGLTTTEEITGQLRSTILSRLSDAIAEAKVAALDLASQYDELSAAGEKVLAPEFAGYGLALARFFIENVSLPEEVEQAIDQRSKLGVLGDRLGQYAQLQSAEAIGKAAENPGGLAGAGVGLGAGVAMGQMMGQALQGATGGAHAAPAPPPAAGATPPPPPPPEPDGARWSLAIGGRTYGPYTEVQMRAMFAAGQVTGETLAWHPGAAGWAALATYPELGGGGAGAAPPLPPSAGG